MRGEGGNSCVTPRNDPAVVRNWLRQFCEVFVRCDGGRWGSFSGNARVSQCGTGVVDSPAPWTREILDRNAIKLFKEGGLHLVLPQSADFSPQNGAQTKRSICPGQACVTALYPISLDLEGRYFEGKCRDAQPISRVQIPLRRRGSGTRWWMHAGRTVLFLPAVNRLKRTRYFVRCAILRQRSDAPPSPRVSSAETSRVPNTANVSRSALRESEYVTGEAHDTPQ